MCNRCICAISDVCIIAWSCMSANACVHWCRHRLVVCCIHCIACQLMNACVDCIGYCCGAFIASSIDTLTQCMESACTMHYCIGCAWCCAFQQVRHTANQQKQVSPEAKLQGSIADIHDRFGVYRSSAAEGLLSG